MNVGDDISDDFTDLQPLFVVPDQLPDFDTSNVLVRCTPDTSPERSLLFSPSQVINRDYKLFPLGISFLGV